jgi:hypothetical protein
MYLHECVVARGLRTDQRWEAGVGAGGEKPGSNTWVWRSLGVNHLVNVEPADMGQHDTSNEEDCRDGRNGEVWRRGDPHDQPPPRNL